MANVGENARYIIDDVTKEDGKQVAEWVGKKGLSYVYIEDNITNPNDPKNIRKAALGYVKDCVLASEARKSKLYVSEFDGNIASRLLQKGLAETFNQVVKKKSPWDAAWTKGLRDEDGKLRGIAVLLHEKEGGKTEVGYMMDPELQGQGLGAGMVMSVLKWSRENRDHTGLSMLKADVDPNNAASVAMLKKLGMTEVGNCVTGKYKTRYGEPVPSQIMEVSGEGVDEAIAAHIRKGGQIFPVHDCILEAKQRARVNNTLTQDDKWDTATNG